MTEQSRTTEERLAELLDSKFCIPGTNIRFGFDAIIGLIPGAGDVLAGVISLYFLIQAAMSGGKVSVLGRMFLNILMDVIVGSIPVLGDFFDVYWKANLRNAQILEELQRDPQKTTSESRFWIWFVLIQFIALIVGVILLITWIIAEIADLLL